MGVGEALLAITYRRSPVTALAATSTAVAVALSGWLLEAPSLAAAPSLVESVEPGVTIDWHQGTISAQAGRAADLRKPSPDVARLGAEREARTEARERLERALRALPLGSGRRLDEEEATRALDRARSAVEYQSNGGAVVTLEVRFGDWSAPTPPSADGAATAGSPAAGDEKSASSQTSPTLSFRVSSARLAAAPLVVAGGREVSLGYALYRLGVPPAADAAVRAKVDDRGRLLVDDKQKAQPGENRVQNRVQGRVQDRLEDRLQDLAGRPALIYVQKPQR